MPQKEGLETIAEVRRLAPEAKIIAISGAFGSRFLTVATHLGANATLSKPIAADVLLRTVDQILSLR
jgi:DNA-binding NarL/FixJ family response regulator